MTLNLDRTSILTEKKKDLEFLVLFQLILLLCPISVPSCKVTHTGSIHKYTQIVMITHYSSLRGWLPSVTFGHKQNQTQQYLPHFAKWNDTLFPVPSYLTKWNSHMSVCDMYMRPLMSPNRNSYLLGLLSVKTRVGPITCTQHLFWVILHILLWRNWLTTKF